MTGAHKDVVLLFERQLYHAERCKVQKGAKCRKMPCVNLVNALDQEVKDVETTQTCTDQIHKLPISIRAMRFAMQKNSED